MRSSAMRCSGVILSRIARRALADSFFVCIYVLRAAGIYTFPPSATQKRIYSDSAKYSRMEKELPVIVILGPKGRVVVPKSIRELIGADEGDALQLGVRKLNIVE